MLVKQFAEDLHNAREAEYIVRNELAHRMPDYKFEVVGHIPLFYNKGDIRAISPSGKEHFIEVKDDSCIWQTNNVLCEEEVFYYNSGELVDGNMYSDYEIYCVIDRRCGYIYVIDFETLKKHYKEGRYTIIHHEEQDTRCYLVSLCQLRQWGALIETISYGGV